MYICMCACLYASPFSFLFSYVHILVTFCCVKTFNLHHPVGLGIWGLCVFVPHKIAYFGLLC